MHPPKVKWLILTLTLTCRALLTSGSPKLRSDNFNLVILHNNDMHGRFEETERNSGTCQEANRNVSCVGGMARTAHIVRAYRGRAAQGTGPPVLFLNAGDSFVGTTWFSVFTWNITSAFINLLEPDAICLGNHEFDLTDTVLSKFIDHLTVPVLSANLNFSQEANLKGKVNSSIVLEKSGRKIGIIGYLTPETIVTSSVGKVTFESEVTAIKRESESLAAQGVNIIIALGHAGYKMDQQIAKEVALVDVVVGGHTNTFLWNGKQPDYEQIEGPYPTIVTQPSGKRVPVIQAYAYTKYLGVLNCTFDSNGDLVEFAGQPILMDTYIPQDQDALELLDVYRPGIIALNEEVIGTSRVYLEGDWTCRHEECNLGNLITDAHVFYALSESTDKWTSIPIGLYNGGGIRTSITPRGTNGLITRGDLIEVLPFGNQVVQLTFKGSDLLHALEQMVRSNGETSLGEFPQVSGLKITLDMTRPTMSRVVSLKVRCGKCDIPVYEPLDLNQNYTLVTSSFLADGGDNVTVLRDRALVRKAMDLADVDVVANYITKFSPVFAEVQGRIRFVNDTTFGRNGGSQICVSWNLLLLVCISLCMYSNII